MQRGKHRKGWLGAGGNKMSRTGSGSGGNQPVWQRALKGLVLAWAVTLIGVFVTAVLIYWEWMSPDWMAAAAKGIMVLSMLAGGVYVFRGTKGRERIWTLVMLIAYLAVRFLLSLILTFL